MIHCVTIPLPINPKETQKFSVESVHGTYASARNMATSDDLVIKCHPLIKKGQVVNQEGKIASESSELVNASNLTLKLIEQLQQHDALPGLSQTKSGRIFDGILQDNMVWQKAEGYVFNSDQFEDGCYITTSEVVQIGHHDSIGYWVETAAGHRYLISDVIEPEQAENNAWYARKLDHVEINAEYFSKIRLI